jgi:hypothetical protein
MRDLETQHASAPINVCGGVSLNAVSENLTQIGNIYLGASFSFSSAKDVSGVFRFCPERVFVKLGLNTDASGAFFLPLVVFLTGERL